MAILIIGGGKMGMSHLALASRYVGKKNVALCESKLSVRIIFRLLGFRTFASADAAALALDRLEGVLIATPTVSHASLAKWAIDKGLPCFVEKPLTLNFQVSNELKELAAARGVPVQVGFVLRYVASFLRLRYLVKSKQLGETIDYKASMRGNVILKKLSADSWRGQFKMGGGCLNEYGPHIIDLCQFIFGPVERVNDVRMNRVFCAQADDRIEFSCSHLNGGVGALAIDWCDTTKRKSVLELEVNFEYAKVRVDNSAVELVWNSGCGISEDERLKIDVPVRPYNVAYYLRGEEFSIQIEEFLRACIGRRFSVDDSIPTDITAGLNDGCEVDRLIDEIARKAGLK